MTTLNLSAFDAALRASLDGDSTDWPDAICLASITKAASDMDRLGLPAEGIYDLSLLFTVTDEDFTSDFDTVVELDNKPIESGSESVETTNGVTKYVINTDYTMDYSNGTITVLSTGLMADSTPYHISYNKDKKSLSLTPLGAFISIDSIEYPAGQTPQKFVNWVIFGNILTITTQVSDDNSQAELTEGYHLVIRYTKKNTIPGASNGGSWDEYMDYNVVLGASAYAMLFRSVAYMQYGREQLDSNTDLWTLFDTQITNALSYLTEGDDYITSINVGDNVPQNYAAYAEQIANLVNQIRQRAEIQYQSGVAAYQMGTALIAAAEKRLSTFKGEITSRIQARGNNFQASLQQFASGD